MQAVLRKPAPFARVERSNAGFHNPEHEQAARMSEAAFTDYPPEVAARARIVNDPAEATLKTQRQCLNAQDLEPNADPWRLTTTNYQSVAHRDAKLGDGWLGITISPDGDASAFTNGSQHWCYGLRSAAGKKSIGGTIRELPLFATLQVDEVRHRHGRPQHEVTEFEQNLDLKSATLSTRRLIRAPSGIIEANHEVWQPRQMQGAVVISLQLTSQVGAWWRVHELLSTAGVPDAQVITCEVDADGDLVLVCDLECMPISETGQPTIRRCVIVSRLLASDDIEWQFDSSSADFYAATRSATINIEPGKSTTISKLVAIGAADSDGDPYAAAKAKVSVLQRDGFHSGEKARLRHEECWQELWQQFMIVDHKGWQQTLNASWFHLLNSVRENTPAGIPPCGLTGNNWTGGVFWDMDSWMQPPIDFFRPELGETLCQYRLNGLEKAQERAARHNYTGADYPWTATPLGEQIGNSEVGELQRHVTSGVARSLWQHYLVTGDVHWLKKTWPVFRATAAYWVSRVSDYTWHGTTGKTVAGVRQPDEYGPIAQCHAMTNATAAWNLRQTTHVAQLLGEEVDETWNVIADALIVPRDPETNRILQWDAWHDGRVIKQADTALLVHPWNIVTDRSEAKDLLDYYGQKYDPYLIMMAKAIDAIVACRIGDAKTAWAITESLLEWYRPPFLTTTESPWNECGSFLTGMGGYLQVFMFGFAGIQISEEALTIQPCLPDTLPQLTLRGIHYFGQTLNITCKNNEVSIDSINKPMQVKIIWSDGTSQFIEATADSNIHVARPAS